MNSGLKKIRFLRGAAIAAAPKAAVAAMAILPLAYAAGAQATTTVPPTSQYYLFQVQNNTGTAQGAFNINLAGDLTTGLGSDYVNPFATPQASATYSSGSPGTTTVTFSSGANPAGTIANGTTSTFGFVDSAEPVSQFSDIAGAVESANWGSGTNTTAVPIADMYQNQPLASSPVHISDPYAVWTIDVAFASDPNQVTKEYYQTAYNTYPPYLLVSNHTGQNEIISNAGYYAPSTQTSALTLSEMEALPGSDFSAPESTSTLYSQLTYTLNAGSSLQFVGYPAVYAPEAATMVLFGVGALGLLFMPRRRPSNKR